MRAVTLRTEPVVDFGGGGLGGAGGAVELLGGGEVVMAHDDLQRFSRDAGIDEALGAAAAEVVGAGVFLSSAGFGVFLLYDDPSLFSDARNNAADMFLGQSAARGDLCLNTVLFGTSSQLANQPLGDVT